MQNDVDGYDLKVAVQPQISLAGILAMMTFKYVSDDQWPPYVLDALMDGTNPHDVPAKVWVRATRSLPAVLRSFKINLNNWIL